MKALLGMILTAAAAVAIAAEPAPAKIVEKDGKTFKEVCAKKDAKGNCTEKKLVPQPKKNPLEEKKKADEAKAAAKAAPAKKAEPAKK